MGNEQDTLLQSIRVLDLTDEKGLLCSRILADMGADVIKIEKPGGDEARSIGPFFHDIPQPEKSLFWFFYNLNKRGITLDIRTSDGQGILKKLVADADVVVESFAPGYMDDLGLGYSSLNELNSRLVVTSISPFGETGPYRDYKTSDIVATAMSGWLYLSGDSDRPPLRVGVPQAYLCAGAEAATQTMIALHYVDVTQEGQHVDVSIQQSMIPNTIQAIPFWQLEQVTLERAGAFRVGLASGVKQRQTWPCKDGFVNFLIYRGLSGAKMRQGLVKLMEEGGFNTDYFKHIEFERPEWGVTELGQDDWVRIEEPIGKFFKANTKEWLLKEGMRVQCAVVPVASPADVLSYPQLEAREFWLQIEHPELDTVITYPGHFAKFSAVPCRVRRRAPLIGEHNMEVYHHELGFSKEKLIMLKQAKVI